MKPLKIGILGLGTVGLGTVQSLKHNFQEIKGRAGRELKITHALVHDVSKNRDPICNDIEISNDPRSVLENPDIDVVVELIGGNTDAYTYVLTALNNNKHVVTANKALIATKGKEIFNSAAINGSIVAYEASVAGGIPIVKVIREALTGNKIESLIGILNGTSNYMLTEMFVKNKDYNDALADAQEKGYAEADPSADVDGYDAAHKLTILGSISFGMSLQYDSVYVEGISSISSEDIRYAYELGFVIKHLAIARCNSGTIELRVHPSLIPIDHILANVNGVMNAIMVKGNLAGNTLYYGAGAGSKPTSSAVIADLVDVARSITSQPETRVPFLGFQSNAVVDNDILPINNVHCAHYIRLNLQDRPGVLAEVTTILGKSGVSISAIHQKGRADDSGNVHVIIITHAGYEQALSNAINEINNAGINSGSIIRIRLEDS